MDVKLLTKEINSRLRRDGAWYTFVRAFKYLNHRPDDFDTYFGTDTARLEPLWKFRIPSKNLRFASHYAAIKVEDLTNAFNEIGEDLAQFTFVDIGCGKGRAMIVAARLGCKRLIGVELVSSLAKTAVANLTKLGVTNSLVIEADAATFRFPEGNIIVYMYNPFGEEVMQQVVNNLPLSRPEKLYVIYCNPRYAKILDEKPALQRISASYKNLLTIIWKKVDLSL